MEVIMKVLLVSVIVTILGMGLCITNFIAPHVIVRYEAVEVPYQEVEDKLALLERLEDHSIGGCSYSWYGYNLESGKTIIISWQADYYVIVYLMTDSQYNVFLSTKYAENLKSNMGKSGEFSYQIPSDGKYYVVIYNPSVLIRVRIVFYEAKLTWQEVITRYRTEYVPREVHTNIYLYSGLTLMAVGVAILPMIKRQQLFQG